jgi:hypothetical protein
VEEFRYTGVVHLGFEVSLYHVSLQFLDVSRTFLYTVLMETQ